MRHAGQLRHAPVGVAAEVGELHRLALVGRERGHRLAHRIAIEGAEPLTQAFVARGRAMSGTSLWDILNEGVLVSRDLWRVYQRVDVIVHGFQAGLTMGEISGAVREADGLPFDPYAGRIPA